MQRASVCGEPEHTERGTKDARTVHSMNLEVIGLASTFYSLHGLGEITKSLYLPMLR